jgi:hypothetical protein
MIFAKWIVILAAVIATACATAAQSPPGSPGWQLEEAPALAPGNLRDWDDFRVGYPCVVRVGDQWRMYYEGTALDDRGLSTGIGMATSRNGVKWQKVSQKPMIRLYDEPDESIRHKRVGSPAVCQREDGTYVMIFRELDKHEGTGLLKAAHSKDGILWDFPKDAQKGVALFSSRGSAYSPWIYRDPDPPRSLCFWYLTSAKDPDHNDLMNAASSDGVTWKEAILQRGLDIDEGGMIEHARVIPSGQFYILCYMVRNVKNGDILYRFRVSRNERSWIAQGPPDYSPSGGKTLKEMLLCGAPSVIFTAEGARLYYEEERPDGTRVIRTAFCPKTSYVGIR